MVDKGELTEDGLLWSDLIFTVVQIRLGTFHYVSLGLVDSKCTEVQNNKLKFTVQSIRCPGKLYTSISASRARL